VVGRRQEESEIEAFLWDYSAGGNVEHIARHNVTPLDVQEVRDNQPHFMGRTALVRWA
jgi:hypothetical protein